VQLLARGREQARLRAPGLDSDADQASAVSQLDDDGRRAILRGLGGLLSVPHDGCVPAKRCAGLARVLPYNAQDVDVGVHRLPSAHRPQRADGCRHHGAAVPAEPSPPSTARRCGAWPLALALRPPQRPPVCAAYHAFRPARLGGLKLCRGAHLLGALPDYELDDALPVRALRAVRQTNSARSSVPSGGSTPGRPR
jgi:hypothetical protein